MRDHPTRRAGSPIAAPPPAGPRCPRCGRSVHRLPDGRLLSLQPLACGYSFAAHICLPGPARYPLPVRLN